MSSIVEKKESDAVSAAEEESNAEETEEESNADDAEKSKSKKIKTINYFFQKNLLTCLLEK